MLIILDLGSERKNVTLKMIDIDVFQNETILVTLLESLQCVLSGRCGIPCVHENEKKSSIFYCGFFARTPSRNGIETSSC